MRLASIVAGSRAAVVVAMVGAGIPCGWPRASLAAAPAAEGTPEGSASFGELMARAEEHRAAWRYVESARAFAAAYDALGEGEQAGLRGEIAIGNAVDDYQLAQEWDASVVALLAEEAALLERYRARLGALPTELEAELARVQGKLDEHQRAQEELAKAEAEQRAEAERRAEEERRAEDAREARARREAEVKRRTEEHLQARAAREAAAEREKQRKAGIAIVSVGLSSVVGGIALMANGGWNRNNVEQRAAALLAELAASPSGTFPMREQYRRDVEAWQSRWERIGTGMLAAGAFTMTAGVGLTLWGAIRLHTDKRPTRHARAVTPWLAGDGLGIAAIGRF